VLCLQQHFSVPKPQDPKSPLHKIGVALGVVGLRVQVLASVQFDDEARLQAGEITNIRTEWMLSSKPVTAQRSLAEMPPEMALSLGRVSS